MHILTNKEQILGSNLVLKNGRNLSGTGETG